MTPIDPVALEALRLLLDAVGPDRLVVIGAAVPAVLIDMRYGVAGGRTTHDIDAVVRTATWEEYEALTRRLVAAGFRQGRVVHRLEFKTAELDLIPYSRTLAPADVLEWPGGERAMSTLGFEEALQSAQPVQLAELVVPFASIAAGVLLKFVAYNDRPTERARDLGDIVHCFERYADEPDDRRYGIGEAVADGAPVTYEEAGAYLLGREVAALAHPESLLTVQAVLASIDSDDARPIAQILSEERRRVGERRRRRALYRLFRVFSASLSERAS